MGSTVSARRTLSRTRDSRECSGVASAQNSSEYSVVAADNEKASATFDKDPPTCCPTYTIHSDEDTTEDDDIAIDLERSRAYPSNGLMFCKRLLDNLAALLVFVPWLPIDSIVLCITILGLAVVAFIADFMFCRYWSAYGMPFVFPKIIPATFFISYAACLGLLETGYMSDHEFKLWVNNVVCGVLSVVLAVSIFLKGTWNPIFAELVEILPARHLHALVEVLDDCGDRKEFDRLMHDLLVANAKAMVPATFSTVLSSLPQVARYDALSFTLNAILPTAMIFIWTRKEMLAVMNFLQPVFRPHDLSGQQADFARLPLEAESEYPTSSSPRPVVTQRGGSQLSIHVNIAEPTAHTLPRLLAAQRDSSQSTGRFGMPEGDGNHK